jgi:cephalosporin hydroxylase
MSMLEHYRTLAASTPAETIVELGIYQGGSTAFFYEAFRPSLLVAFELGRPAPALERFVTSRGLEEVVRLHYGVDQGDTGRLLHLLRSDLVGRVVDLVVDDASHFYTPTRASFEAIFPLVRPGGLYIIEDWNWVHYPRDFFSRPNVVEHFRSGHPLTDLALDLVKVAGTSSDVIREVRIDAESIQVVRGSAELDAPIDLADHVVEHDLWSGDGLAST